MQAPKPLQPLQPLQGLTVVSLEHAIAAPFAGSLSDKVGRKTMLTFTLLSMALAMIGMCLRWSPRAGRAEPDPSPQHP